MKQTFARRRASSTTSAEWFGAEAGAIAIPTHDNNQSNVNNVDNLNIPPIYVIDVYGPRGLQVIVRNPDVPEIAAYGRTLPQKVADFREAKKELKRLKLAQRELVVRCAAQAQDLKATTLTWRVRTKVGLKGLEAQDITITETKVADVVLANAVELMEVLVGREDQNVPDAVEAAQVLEAKYASTKATFDALHVGRAAVQGKQRELRVLAALVHEELVSLRRTVRAMLGSTHVDSQYLRVPKGRAAAELAQEAATEPTSTDSSSG